jgi:hypothetical protein
MQRAQMIEPALKTARDVAHTTSKVLVAQTVVLSAAESCSHCAQRTTLALADPSEKS